MQFAAFTLISNINPNTTNPNNTDIAFSYIGYAVAVGGLGGGSIITITSFNDGHDIEQKIIQTIIDDVYITSSGAVTLDKTEVLIPAFIRYIK